MTFDAYTVYCNHQRARGAPIPSREWWDKACAKRRAQPKQSDFDKDIEIERREGYAYDADLI